MKYSPGKLLFSRRSPHLYLSCPVPLPVRSTFPSPLAVLLTVSAMAPLLNYACLMWIISCSFSSSIVQSSFSFLLMVSKNELRDVSIYWFLFLALLLVFICPFQMFLKSSRGGKESRSGRRMKVLYRPRVFSGAWAEQESGAEIVKVPLGIKRATDIKCVLKGT